MEIMKIRILSLVDGSGKTDSSLEEAIGLPRGIIYKWRNDKNKNFKFYAIDIASYFHVSTDYLLGRTDDPRPIGESHDVSSFPSLNGEVGELVDIFNSLTKDGKTMLLGVARSLLSNPAYSLNRVEEKMAE